MIINSRQSNMVNQSSHKSQQQQQQYSSIRQILHQQQQSVIQWIHQQFSSYLHCRQITQIQDLFDGIVIAEIISEFLSQYQQIQEEFLNQIEMTNLNYQKCLKNINEALKVLKNIVKSIMVNVNKCKMNNNIDQEQVQIIRIVMKSLQNVSAQLIINDRHKMVQFFIQIIMILPEIKRFINIQQINDNKQHEFRSNQLNNRNQNNGLEQISSIYYQSRITNGINGINGVNNINNTYDNKYVQVNKHSTQPKFNIIKNFPHSTLLRQNITKQNQPQLIYHYQQQQQIQKLLHWVSQQFSLPINQLSEPHLLLGELINSIFCGGRLSQTQSQSNQFIINMVHILCIKRLQKYQLKWKGLLEDNIVKERTYWDVIEDLYKLRKNKVNYASNNTQIKQNKTKNYTNNYRNNYVTHQNDTQSIKQRKITDLLQFDENINHDHLKNQSITQLLKNNKSNKQKKQKLKQCPLYDQKIIKQTQIWLQQQMGMGYSLNKSKQLNITITTTVPKLFQNPLLNGTILSKLIQRLKIGCSKGIITTPIQPKHIKSNIDIIKNQLLKRGYECVRKLDIYKANYNFYVGLISEIREVYVNKQTNVKNMIKNDKIKKKQQEEIEMIQNKQKDDIKQWINKQYNVQINHINNQLHIDLNMLKIVIQSVLSLNFLRQTTEKIRNSNYVKLLEFFRNIGFSQYYHINVEDITNQYHKNKNTQNVRWIILRDLRIVKEQKKLMIIKK